MSLKTLKLRNKIIIVALAITAMVFTIWSMSRIPDYAHITINKKWTLMFMGAENFDEIELNYKGSTSLVKVSEHYIKITGQGSLRWKKILVLFDENSLMINDTAIERTTVEGQAMLYLYPDGRIVKDQIR